MPNALLTGRRQDLAPYARALTARGFDVVAEEQASFRADHLQPLSVHCYVQLPATAPDPGRSAFLEAQALVTVELRERFEVMARALPLLAPGARVVLAGRAGGMALGSLATAVAADRRADGVSASLVDAASPASEVAALASRACAPRRRWEEAVLLEPEAPFAEWRHDLMAWAAEL